MARFLIISVIALAAAGCVESKPATDVRRVALGEPIGEYPSYEERLLLYLTNRARVAPTDVNPDDPYPPTPPLQFDYDLNVAARFHARHIVEAGCWCEDHSSCCELGGTGEDVACSGAVTGCGAMSAEERLALFSPSYAGENMAQGQASAFEAMQSWAFSPGHWANINGSAGTMGAGHSGNAWVQDFGSGGAPTLISDGIHFAEGATTRFGTTYRQMNSGGPRTALVIVEGECHDLGIVHGEPEHGAFEATVQLGPGCHRYYFHFTDGNGNDVTYPSFGSFGVGVSTSDCEFFIDTRPADTCSPSGQTCMTGDTRHCYTGPFGTEGVGICEPGAERCVAGQWDGACRLEVGPADAELCENMQDDDCDGEVDEDCASTEDVGAPDATNTDVATETGPKLTKSDGGCAVTGEQRLPLSGWILLIAAVMARRMRRRD